MIPQKHDCKTLHWIRCKLSYSLSYYVQDPGSTSLPRRLAPLQRTHGQSHSNPMQSACRHGSHMQTRTNASTHMQTLTDVRRAQSKVHPMCGRADATSASPYVRHSFEDFQDVLVLHAQIHIHCNQQNFTEHRDRGQRSVTFPSARSAVYTCTNDLLPSNAKH